MNKVRRKKLGDIQSRIEELMYLLEEVRDEEQEAMDNVPESLWGTKRYEAMETAVSNMEDALTSLQDAGDSLQEVIE